MTAMAAYRRPTQRLKAILGTQQRMD